MALFQKGQINNPKGRPKGAKDRIRFDVGQICENEGFNPFLELINLARNPKTGSQVKCDALSQLCSYLAPKLKSVELTQEEAKQIRLQMQFGNMEMKQPDAT